MQQLWRDDALDVFGGAAISPGGVAGRYRFRQEPILPALKIAEPPRFLGIAPAEVAATA